MSRQLNLRVSNEFVERLERLAKRLGRPMSAVLELVGNPAIKVAEADLLFEAEALVAWEEYELTGVHVTASEIELLFTDALEKANTLIDSQRP